LRARLQVNWVLSLPKRKDKFRVETNALGHAIGGVLLQEKEGK